MRSRFSAFALGEVDYLWRTLHSAHADRPEGEAAFVAAIRRSRQAMKYVRLRVLDHDLAGERGRVLFHAELYEKGKDRSFLELSLFEREGQAWRYLSGEGRALSPSAPGLDSLTIAISGLS